MKYRVQGTYEMKFFVEVNEVVEAEDPNEAMMDVQDGISAGQAYDQECEWVNSGPVVTEEK